jgi:hypothetical protein
MGAGREGWPSVLVAGDVEDKDLVPIPFGSDPVKRITGSLSGLVQMTLGRHDEFTIP